MILRRLGNKSKIAMSIQKHFPQHDIYVEPFFGAGGMFFNKPKAKYNIVNDIDSEVFNLFQVVVNKKEELKELFYKMPIHQDLLEYWKTKTETDDVKKAVRFLFLSNCTFLGTGSQIRLTTQDDKLNVYDNIQKTFDYIFDVTFSNSDFRKFIKNISYRHGDQDKERTFFYCDPPYLATIDNYSHSFTQQDSIDLFDALEATGCKFAMSEFNNETIIDEATKRGLNIITVGERRNLKNVRTEILVTNYKNPMSLFDGW